MDSEVPASTQISQLSWIVGNLSAYAGTHWQVFSTYDINLDTNLKGN